MNGIPGSPAIPTSLSVRMKERTLKNHLSLDFWTFSGISKKGLDIDLSMGNTLKLNGTMI